LNYAEYFLGLCSVFISFFGYMTFFHEKLKIEASFTPILTVSAVTIFMYLVGFTGLLQYSSIAVYVIGAVLFTRTVYLCFRKRYSVSEFVFSPGIIAFCLFALFFIIRTRGLTLLHVDNFSHWATAVKDMCLTDAYPKLSGAVTFRNYTPGAAVFIYHVCNAVGFTESHALMSQGILISACAAPLFCRVKSKDVLTFTVISGIFVSALTVLSLEGASLAIYNLTVDGLIAHFAAAGGVIAYAYRRDARLAVTILAPLTVMLSLIKSSGKIFALFLIIFAFVLLFKEYFRKTPLKKKFFLTGVLGGTLALNLILPWFWDLYADVVFKGYQNKFPSGLGVLATIRSKDPSYLKQIFMNILTELKDFTSPSVKLLLVSFIIAFTVTVLCAVRRSKTKFMLGVCLTSLAVLVFYVGELFVLYGFIFPEAEAVILASFYRYFATAVILLSTVLLTASVYAVRHLVICKKAPRLSTAFSLTLAAVICAVSLLTVKDNLPLITDPYRDDLAADALEKREYFGTFYAEVSKIVPPDSYVIVFTEKTDFFTSTLPQYELRTSHCMFIYPYFASFQELVLSRLEYPDYFVVESGEETFRSIAESYGYSFSGNGTVYHVDRDNKILKAK